MANNYLTPGIYVQEISTLPGVVVEVQSAIPAFIGYTQNTRYDGRSMLGVPEYITSFKDFEERFGGAPNLYLDSIKVKTDLGGKFSAVDSIHLKRCFLLYETIYMYFANGGGDCYIVSTGAYEDTIQYDKQVFLDAIEALDSVDDVTLLVMPEAVLLEESCYTVQQAALAHCAKRMNRFAILDIKEETKDGSLLLHWKNEPDKDAWRAAYQDFRNRIGIMNLSYGAAYTPYVIADTPADFSYYHLKDYLFDADQTASFVTPEPQETPSEANEADAESSPGEVTPAVEANGESSMPPLSMATLDPTAKRAIIALDHALEDMANLMDAVDEAKMKLLKVSSKADLPRLFSDVIAKACPPGGKGNIKTLADTYCGLLASILGIEITDKAAGSGFRPHTMSQDMAQHTIDSLKAIIAKSAALSKSTANAPGSMGDNVILLTSLHGAMAELAPQDMIELIGDYEELLFTDLYNAASKNIERLSEGLHSNSTVYRSIHSAVQKALRVQPPSAVMAGVYAATDRSRGVWKAPANVSVANVLGLTQVITADAQESLNSDSVAGKSINALRSFPGRGFLVWGARTLDGNSLEWRYIPVRRFFITVEESVRRATTWAIFEPNDSNLWSKVKSVIDNYLLQKWKEGALLGAAPNEAYFVNVGLGSTMTEQDILEGRLIVDIGMAVVRPAEFIILRFMHKMQQS